MSKVTLVLGLTLIVSCGSQSHVSSLAQNQVPDEVANEMIGHYAMLMTYASNQKFPIVGRVKTLGYLYKIADITMEDGGLTITEKSCRLTFDGGAIFGLTFADSSIQSAPLMKGRFIVTQDSADSPIRFSREILTQVLGATLTDPMFEPLPESKDDPRVIDMENDGSPGATAGVRAFFLRGTMDYVLRSTNRYEGTVDESGTWQGLLKDRTDGVVLDMSNLLLKPAIGKIEFIPDSDPNKSTVQIAKIDEGLDCTTVNWTSL